MHPLLPRRAGVTALATAAALGAGIGVPMLSSAQTPTGRTLTFQEDEPAVNLDDVAPKSKRGKLSVGDRLTIAGNIFSADKTRLGTFSGTCTVLAPGSFDATPVLCSGAYDLADGEILFAGRAPGLKSIRFTVYGGTGAYVGAHGTVTSAVKPAPGYDDADVVTLDA